VTRKQQSASGELGGERVPGRRAVRELLISGKRQVSSVWIARGRDSNATLDEIAELSEAAGVRVRMVDAERVRTEARTESAQGVVAIAAPVAPTPLAQLCTGERPFPFLVVLDGVTDPGNLGAVLRTAETAGATGAVLPRHRAALLTPAAMKAAAGAAEHLPIALVGGIPGALDDLRRAQVWSVGLDASGASSIFDLEVADSPVALVLGAEGRGVSRLARERCDVLASIPMRGRLESINVAAAAAVACFEVTRRRGR
jgi:23S rRNA (guanosine2251-2'-O)-methyltransferase